MVLMRLSVRIRWEAAWRGKVEVRVRRGKKRSEETRREVERENRRGGEVRGSIVEGLSGELTRRRVGQSDGGGWSW
jgi:hypothetical protein